MTRHSASGLVCLSLLPTFLLFFFLFLPFLANFLVLEFLSIRLSIHEHLDPNLFLSNSFLTNTLANRKVKNEKLKICENQLIKAMKKNH